MSRDCCRQYRDYPAYNIIKGRSHLRVIVISVEHHLDIGLWVSLELDEVIPEVAHLIMQTLDSAGRQRAGGTQGAAWYLVLESDEKCLITISVAAM